MEIKRLKELETHEVSIVDRPANRRTFLVLKNETSIGDKDMEDKILSLLDTPFENEEQYLENLKKNEMSNDAIQAIAAAMRLLKPHQEALSGEAMNVVKELLGIEKEEDPTSDDSEGTTDTELDINEVPEDVRSQVEGLFKSQSEAIQKAEELEKEINVMKAEKLRKQFVAKAESDFSSVPGTTAVDLGELLQELSAVAPEATSKIESILGSVNKAMETSVVLEEAGQAVQVESGTAWDKVEARAAEMRKANPDLSVYQARAKVLESNTDLFQAYNEEFELNKRSL